MGYITIESEGLLISPEVLQKIAATEVEGQKPVDFGLPARTRLTDEIAASWSDALAYYEAFQRALSRLKDGDSGATPTREQWILPLLRSLGWEKLSFMKSAAQVGGQTYFISHREGGEDGVPVHIEGANIKLDSRPPSGTPRISPQALLQEYLNRTEHLWAIVTNGRKMRILRDSARLSRATYLEFDLEQMMIGKHFAEFQILYRLLHRSRWPAGKDTASSCLLEKYYLQSIAEGGRVREHLREGVGKALRILGNGFLRHPDNTELINKLKKGEVTAIDFYSQLLRLVYRFLFLMVAEERRLAGPDPADELRFGIYHDFYSIRNLRARVQRHFNPQDRFWDTWEAIKQTFSYYSSPSAAEKLGMTALDGGLFTTSALPDLESARLYNRDFLAGFAHLSLFKDRGLTRPINYSHLDVEEIGSVYESLLDFHPQIESRDAVLEFSLVSGMGRKTTGSYYTRPELVQELIKSTLVPVINERLTGLKTKEEKEKALLSIRVCDPASGSGHFLLAAARRIGRELASVRTGEDYPPPDQVRPAVRDAIRHCIYGVDINPLAVDLCRVALWLEGHCVGQPLTFLDHRIKCGNSLVGVDNVERLKQGIPDEAFKPVTGDNKDAAKKIRAQNKQERERLSRGQMPLTPATEGRLEADLAVFASESQRLDSITEDSVDGTALKRGAYYGLHEGEAWLRDWTACHIWTAAFYRPLLNPDDPAVPSQGKLVQFINNPKACDARLAGEATGLAALHRFFHWPLEFPEVMKAGGFEVVLSNPPWERIKLQEKEFFSQLDPAIADAPNKAARERLIKELAKKNPDLLKEFEQAKHAAEAESRFVRASGRFPLTAVGDINMYALFAELARCLINPKGRAGIIVPTGIATDDTTKNFFSSLVEGKNLVSILGFINEELLFPTVLHNFKFCTIVIAGPELKIEEADFAFLCYNLFQAKQPERHFKLSSSDFSLLNPNTRTCPVFRTAADARLTQKIHHSIPVLVNEQAQIDPWRVRFLTLFHMANDSGLFATRFDNGLLPLYEGKMMYQYDHRFASFESLNEQERSHMLPETTLEKHQNVNYTIQPCYYVSRARVDEKLDGVTNRGWLLGFREVTSSGLARSIIASVLPRAGVGHNTVLIFLNGAPTEQHTACFLGNLNSIVFDYVARQKIGGASLSNFIVKQLPALPPTVYTTEAVGFIIPRVLELVYTAYDLEPFATDMGYTEPPFKWDENKRALCKAELDAYYARLYGLIRDELCYILDPHDVHGPDFPGETFRVLKNKEMKEFGEYRTRRLVLEAWDRLEKGELK